MIRYSCFVAIVMTASKAYTGTGYSTVTSHQRKCKSKESRKEWLDCLEQVEELHQLSKQELTCDQCGQMMTVIGKHEQYREVKLVSAHLCCKIVCTETARCEHC